MSNSEQSFVIMLRLLGLVSLGLYLETNPKPVLADGNWQPLLHRSTGQMITALSSFICKRKAVIWKLPSYPYCADNDGAKGSQKVAGKCCLEDTLCLSHEYPTTHYAI